MPYKFRLRRSSTQMADDPFTLLVTVNNKVFVLLFNLILYLFILFLFFQKGTAAGELYFDDAVSFNYRKSKEFVHRSFAFNKNKLVSK